jgi:hypothetical protein
MVMCTCGQFSGLGLNKRVFAQSVQLAGGLCCPGQVPKAEIQASYVYTVGIRRS